jgi:hypothetical protein
MEENADLGQASDQELHMSELLRNLHSTAFRFMILADKVMILADKLPEGIEEDDQQHLVGMTTTIRDILDVIEMEYLPLVVLPYEGPYDEPTES